MTVRVISERRSGACVDSGSELTDCSNMACIVFSRASLSSFILFESAFCMISPGSKPNRVGTVTIPVSREPTMSII